MDARDRCPAPHYEHQMRIGIIRKSVQGSDQIPSRAVIGAEGLPGPTNRAVSLAAVRQRHRPSLQGHDAAASQALAPRRLRGSCRRLAVVFDVGRMPGSITKLFCPRRGRGPGLRRRARKLCALDPAHRSCGCTGLAMSRCCRWRSARRPGLATLTMPGQRTRQLRLRPGPSRSARRPLAQGCPRTRGADHPRRGRRRTRARSRRFHQGGYRGLGASPAARQHGHAAAVSAYA